MKKNISSIEKKQRLSELIALANAIARYSSTDENGEFKKAEPFTPVVRHPQNDSDLEACILAPSVAAPQYAPSCAAALAASAA